LISELGLSSDKLKSDIDIHYSVDIIIAARNEARHLAECLHMLQEQNYPRERIRIFVIDDGSADDTAEIACRADVEVLKGAGRGQASARNMAIRAGSGDLIAFLDAHCIVDANWVRSMASAFTDYRVGGCLSRIDYRADDPRVQALLDHDSVSFSKHYLGDTVRGKTNLYPWVITAACMFRRTAIEEQGGFDESLSACEDTEISWSVISLGYQLAYLPQAIAVHYEQRSLWSYIFKGRVYGRGAAEVAARYRRHGAAARFRAGRLIGRSLLDTLQRLIYAAGYHETLLKFRLLPGSRPAEVTVQSALDSLRPSHPWNQIGDLRVARDVTYWPIPEEDTSVIVHIPTRARFILENSGNEMWMLLSSGSNRSETLRKLNLKYGDVVEKDLDDFVESLIDTGLLELRPRISL